MKHDTKGRELTYYLSLHYPVTVHSDPEGGFVAEIEELPGCMTQADTLDEVFAAIEEARELWIRTAYNEGQDIPLPRDMEEYTGKFLVRIPRTLHRTLVHAAKQERVSLNQYVTSLLVAGVTRGVIGPKVGAVVLVGRVKPGLEIFGTTEATIDYDALLSMSQRELR